MELDNIKQEIKTMLARMNFLEEVETVEVHQGTTIRFSVKIRNQIVNLADDFEPRGSGLETSLLIGERGCNLAAFEHILKKIIKKKYETDLKFTLDINDYRFKQLENLKQDVKAAAKEVRLYKKEVPLGPMSAFERRIVHLLLAEYPDIATESIGQEPQRRVIIKPYP